MDITVLTDYKTQESPQSDTYAQIKAHGWNKRSNKDTIVIKY